MDERRRTPTAPPILHHHLISESITLLVPFSAKKCIFSAGLVSPPLRTVDPKSAGSIRCQEVDFLTHTSNKKANILEELVSPDHKKTEKKMIGASLAKIRNREISRDCQELEHSIGEQLASLLYLEPDSDLMAISIAAELKRELASRLKEKATVGQKHG
ncbi:hypothetical protein OROGR_031029 [Orobanche gracilis]